MYYSFIYTLCVVTCIQCVLSQSTNGATYNTKCDKSSSEIKVLVEKILTVESEMNRMKQFLQVTDCSDLQVIYPSLGNGIYTIRLPSGPNQQVFCDMLTDGGGWLVFQKRQDGSENFYRNWADYKSGFGRIDGEFWLGNDALTSITNQRSYELRVDLEDFEGHKVYAKYTEFSMAGMEDKYRLSLGTYSGNAGDSFTGHNGKQFTTFDQDNDDHSGNCAISYKGGWWYSKCHSSNLNGQYLRGNHTSYADGINWYAWRGHHYSLKVTEMKIRPKYS